MKVMAIVIIGVVLGLSALALWACCAAAGECSREEEKRAAELGGPEDNDLQNK